MISDLLIYHHLGLGDSIMCNGIIRNYANNLNAGSSLYVFSKPASLDSVKFMYRDDDRIKVIEMNDYDGSNLVTQENLSKFITENNIKNAVFIGFSNPNFWPLHSTGLRLDELFYTQAGMNINNKWDLFKVHRDKNREIEAYNELNPNNEEYIFLQDDVRYRINGNKIPSGIKIIAPVSSTDNNSKFPSKYNIFDYLTLIERAKEVHIIPSSFLFMLDQVQGIIHDKIFCHWYCRQPMPHFNIPVIRNKGVINLWA